MTMSNSNGLDLSLVFPVSFGNVVIDPWVIAEVFLVASLFVYCAYASLVVWQVYIMSETISTPISPYLKSFAWLHLVLALSLFASVIFYWI